MTNEKTEMLRRMANLEQRMTPEQKIRMEGFLEGVAAFCPPAQTPGKDGANSGTA